MQQDVGAYDSEVFSEEECKHAFGEDPNNITNAHYENYFDLVKVSLLKKRGKPKDQSLPRGVVATITPMTDVHRADLFVAASDTASDMAIEAVEHLEQGHTTRQPTINSYSTVRKRFVCCVRKARRHSG